LQDLLVFLANFSYFLDLMLEGTKRETEYVQAVHVLVLVAVLHLVQLEEHFLVVRESVDHEVLLSTFSFGAALVEELLEVVDLPDLTLDGESLVIGCPDSIVVADGFLRCFEQPCEQKKAANDESCSTLACLAMHGHNRLMFREVLFNLHELIFGHLVTLVFFA
jgi:hypothetical protein